RFGVAQGVVREALLELQAMGLVETIDNRGIYVAKLNSRRFVDAFEVRAAIEGMAVRLCCDRCSRADLRDLQVDAEQIFQCARTGEPDRGVSLDRAFHHRLVELSGNEELVRMTDNYRAFGKIVRLDRDPEAVHREHLMILEAIISGDAD